MEQIRLIWHNIGQLDAKRKIIVTVFVIVIVATWLSACVLLSSALLA